MSKLADKELLEEIQERSQEAMAGASIQNLYSEECQRFWSGDQFSVQEIRERKRNRRPALKAYNICKTYVHAVVNPLRENPNGIIVTTEDEETTEELRDVVRGIEQESDADEAYETAFENIVVSGVGYIGLTTAYTDDESLDQVVQVFTIANTSSVLYDPSSKEINGSDAEWCMVIDAISEDVIEDKYGEEVADQGGDAVVTTTYKHIKVPESTIPMVCYYKKVYKNVKRWWFADGTYIDQAQKPELPSVGSRVVSVPSVSVTKLIGKYVIEETTMQMSGLPIVPVYGEANRDLTGVRWTGLIENLRALQEGVNIHYNSELEMVDALPLSPFMATKEQILGQEQYWNRANQVAFPTLVYNAVEGQSRPERTNNSSNIQQPIAGRQALMADAGRLSGITDQQLGDQQGANESGIAGTGRVMQSEKQTAHFYQNWSKSMKRVGNMMVELIFSTYSGVTAVPVVNESNEASVRNVNFDALKKSVGKSKVKVDVTIGQMLKSTRQRDLENVAMLQNALPEDKKNAFLDIIAENSFEGKSKKEVLKRAKMLIPQEFQENTGAIDPMAEQALQSAQMAIQAEEQKNAQMQEALQMQQRLIDQLNQQIFELQSDSTAMLQGKAMDNNTKLQQEAMKQQGLNERQLAQMIADQQAKFDQMIEDMRKEFGARPVLTASIPATASAISGAEPINLEQFAPTEMPTKA